MRKWAGLVIPSIFGVTGVYISQSENNLALFFLCEGLKHSPGWASTLSNSLNASSQGQCVYRLFPFSQIPDGFASVTYLLEKALN